MIRTKRINDYYNLSVTIRFVIAFIAFFPTSQFALASLLVVAPHPDDDIIIAAGITEAATRRGEQVTIVYMTNGDKYSGVSGGQERQEEAVAAQALLGLNENNLIFLGYPDGYLDTVYYNYPASTDQLTAQNGVSETYANHGLGMQDYHSYRFGSPGAYNKYNIMVDLKDILQIYRPTHILTLVEFDEHPDHAITYEYVRQSLIAVNQIDNTYVPTLHKSVVHIDPTLWPESADPSTYYTPPPEMYLYPVQWADRISIDVPPAMQIIPLASNLKNNALLAHASQIDEFGFIERFVHKDEFFWIENPVGVSQPPRVSAGNDLFVNQGDVVQLNGTESTDPDSGTLSYQWMQVSGTSVALNNANSAMPTFTAPTNSTQPMLLEFSLSVSDGQFVSIPDRVLVTVDGDLDSDGLADNFELSIGTDPLLADSDGDGLSDYAEVNYDGDATTYTPGADLNPLSLDTDMDGIQDDVDPIPLNFNFGDGDLAPLGAPDGVVNAADILIATRIVTNMITSTTMDLAHGDLYPPGAPDGQINISDLLLIMKIVQGLP